jgi:hypothetical protein
MIWIILGVALLAVVDVFGWWFIVKYLVPDDELSAALLTLFWCAAHLAAAVGSGIMLIRYGVGQLA